MSESEAEGLHERETITEGIDASHSEESMDGMFPRTQTSSKAPSVADSVPNSPASSTMHSDETEFLRETRKWQKNIMNLWRLANTHKYITFFQGQFLIQKLKDILKLFAVLLI